VIDSTQDGPCYPLGIKIGLDAVKRLDAEPRELAVTYCDSGSSPGIAQSFARARNASLDLISTTLLPLHGASV
jgi:hypothetical protein